MTKLFGMMSNSAHIAFSYSNMYHPVSQYIDILNLGKYNVKKILYDIFVIHYRCSFYIFFFILQNLRL